MNLEAFTSLIKITRRAIPFLSIACAEIVKATLLILFPAALVSFYVAQALGSILQGWLSDRFSRQVNLCVSLLVLVLISVVGWAAPTWTGKLWLFAGLAGNAGTIGRGAMIDVYAGHPTSKRTLMSRAMMAESGVWILISALLLMFNLKGPVLFVICLSASFATLLLAIFILNDPTKSVSPEDDSLLQESERIINKRKLGVLFLLFLLEAGFFLYFYDLNENMPNNLIRAEAALQWAIALFLGSWIAARLPVKFSDWATILAGTLASILGNRLWFRPVLAMLLLNNGEGKK